MPDFSLNNQNRKKAPKDQIGNIPNGHAFTKNQIPGLSKYSKFCIFGMQVNHLATAPWYEAVYQTDVAFDYIARWDTITEIYVSCSDTLLKKI